MPLLENGVSEISLRQALANGLCPNCGNHIEWNIGKIEDAITGKHCDREFTINVMDSSVTVAMKIVPLVPEKTANEQLKARESDLSKSYGEATTKYQKEQIRSELDEIKEARKK